MILTSVLVLGKFAKNGIAYFLGQGKISAKEPGLCNQMREIKIQLKTFFYSFPLNWLINFFSTWFFCFFNLLFRGFWKVIWYFVSSPLRSGGFVLRCLTYKTFINWEKKVVWVTVPDRTVVCNYIIDIISFPVVCNLRNKCKCSFFARGILLGKHAEHYN